MIKREFSFFIAGSTEDIKDERICLKALANDLNSEYRTSGIRLNALSFKDIDDSQEKYNDFIEHEADLVIFVLKGGLGDWTREELFKAVNTWRKKGVPEIIVFLHKDSISDSMEKYICGLMEGLLDRKFPIKYDKPEDLRNEAKVRIVRHIQYRNNKLFIEEHTLEKVQKKGGSKSSTPTHSFPFEHEASSCRKNLTTWILSAAIVILGCLFLWSHLTRKTKPLLVFAGGGSVAQFIKATSGFDVDSFDNSIYLRMPSSHSWTLLSEEVNRKINLDGKTEINNKYYPISLSADEAPDSVFVKACTEEQFTQKAAVVSCYLGEDTLMLYVSRNLREKHAQFDKDTTGAEDLDSLMDLMHKQQIQILHTTPGSGTLRAWQSFMSPQDSVYMQTDIKSIFNESSNANIANNKDNFIALLGSKYYYMEQLMSSVEHGMKPLYIKNKNGEIASKPIFLYFVALYDNQQDHSKLRIPKEVLSFIKKLRIPIVVWKNDSIWQPNEGTITPNGKVVIHLNKRPICYSQNEVPPTE